MKSDVRENLKRILIMVVAVFVIAGCSGCSMLAGVMKQLNREEYAEFYNEGGRINLVSKEEIMTYESLYPECNSTWFCKQLSGDDLYVYNALLYAMEHNYTDSRIYVDDPDMDVYKARDCLSLDSPFLEQNYSPGEEFYIYTDNSIGFHMDRFNQEQWALKMQALEQAEKILEDIPAGLTDVEDRMQFLYDYVCENVEYVTYEDEAEANYLYDAVCKGASLCDGYSNMLSLLFNLDGIECCEAMGDDTEEESLLTEEETEASEGHTWVVAELDGEMFNFDPTFDTDSNNRMKDYSCYFGVSDRMISVKCFAYNDLRPLCDNTVNDFNCADVVISDIYSDDDARKVADISDEKAAEGQYRLLLAVTGSVNEDAIKDFMDTYINKTELIMSVNYTYMIYDSRTLILLEAET